MRRTLALSVTAVVAGLVPWSLPAHAGGGCHEEVTQGSTAEVKAHGACFQPMVNTVATGTTVSWFGADLEHNVTGPGTRIGFHELRPGTPVRIRFDVPGTYPYSCTIHSGMNGVILVGDGGRGEAAPQTTTTPVDTVALSDEDGAWTDNAAAVGGAGAGVLALGLVSGLAFGRRRPRELG